MNLSDLALLVASIVLVLLAGVVAASEAALTRVSRVQVDDSRKDRRRGWRHLQQVTADLTRYLNLLLLVRTIMELTATVLAAILCTHWFSSDWAAVLVAVAAMTVAAYVLIGVAPRTVGLQHADSVSLATAGLAVALNRLLGPVPRLLILLGNALTPGRGFREGPFNTEEELRDLVDLAEERHLIESGERAMIHGVFELGDTIVRSVMVPRPDIVSIGRDKTLRQALSLCLRSGYSRIPVLGENEDDIVGIIYLKDLVRRTHEVRDSENTMRVEQVMRPPTFVPDSKPVDELLREMQARHIHVAVVVDEYGGTAGLVTIEDILEEIVGEITDEYDRELPRVETLDQHTMRVTARLPIDELNELFGTDIEIEDIDTVGGLLASALGRVPIPGAEARVDGLVLTAERAAGRRNQIGTVVVRRVVDVADPDTEPETEPADARS
ncbi:MAG: magnesium and cobalt exporter, family [Frankiales bacterium]|nr:magnesium and cobalt exporter, family [Frankiales bacterium]MDX6245954.1 magnesium and cobalt exporter, family [Frankiales bacterium]